MVFRRSKSTQPTESLLKAEDALASTLLGNGDSLPAWNAVWDLVQSSDSQAKQEVLDALRSHVDAAATGESVERAQEFSTAIEKAMGRGSAKRQLLPSAEVREQAKQDHIEANRKAMRDMGVRPGEGLPMWAMYMTRRNKRTWS